jgi:anaerobic selenocysteine-containing dehydrogenase
MLRSGPYKITLADLEAAPHGIDFGPLRPRLLDVLATESRKIELAAPAITCDMPRLKEAIANPVARFVLVGRRQTSSNNSWMHNLAPLVQSSNRCIAQISPQDAVALGVCDNGQIRITSRTGSVTVSVEVIDAMRPGVVSVPHGWGHDEPDTRTLVARAHAGVNSNIMGDELLLDVPSGTLAINGIPVDVVAV